LPLQRRARLAMFGSIWLRGGAFRQVCGRRRWNSIFEAHAKEAH